MEYLSADAWNQKPLREECFKKPYHSISARVIRGQGQNAVQQETASEEQTDYSSISELCISARHYLLIKGFVFISGFIIHTPREETVTVGGGGNQRQRESETRWWKKLFHRYRWWWSSACIWNQVFSSVSPEVSSVQQMDVTKPRADTTQIKCLKQTPQAQKNCLKFLLLSWWKSVSAQRQQKTAASVLARL